LCEVGPVLSRTNDDISLVCMPWYALGFPSIQLGTLQAVLERAGVGCRSHSLHLGFQDFLTGQRHHGRAVLSLDDYGDICGRWARLGAGDWAFALPALRRSSKARDERYFKLCRAEGMPKQLCAKLRHLRELVPLYLESCADEILERKPGVVGFTLTFSQVMASMALAHTLKARDPKLKIVVGGSGCEGPMGTALLAAFDVIDVVVRGEAEDVLPQLVTCLTHDAPLPAHANLCFRQGGRVEDSPGHGAAPIPMDSLPVPQYGEYFERLRHSSLANQVLPQVTFESARGCWWGMKSHCTFCGINGLGMTFRSKSPERVLEEVSTLAARHNTLDFSAVDAILDMGYFKTVLPRLVEREQDLSFFYETKSNLTRAQVALLRSAGVTAITPGIESLSSHTLKLMKKGVTALQNIRLLKWCALHGLRVAWTLLYGFPGERPQEYARMAKLVPSLVHLFPPSMGPLQMYRFSPYHERPEEHGLRVGDPLPHYGLIYDLDGQGLTNIAHAFDYTYLDGRDPESYVGDLKEQVDRWAQDWDHNRGALTYRRGPGFMVVTDTRTGRTPARYTLTEPEARVYLACADGATPGSIAAELAKAPGPGLTTTALDALLQDFVDNRLTYEEDGRFLSLALPNVPKSGLLGP
jgi:ribosomal peptide maturation radical SAM protein 1